MGNWCVCLFVCWGANGNYSNSFLTFFLCLCAGEWRLAGGFDSQRDFRKSTSGKH